MRAFREIPTDTSHRADSETIFTGADTTDGFDTGFVMSGPASIPAERLLPASVKPGPAGYPPVKVRAAAADLLPERSLYHQETQSMVKDYLKYDEVPGVTNCSTANLPAGFRIERHVHPSKVRKSRHALPHRARPDDPTFCNSTRFFWLERARVCSRCGPWEPARATNRARCSS